MERICWITSYGESPKGKNYIFIAAHPADAARWAPCFPSLRKEICDTEEACAFWYDARPGEPWSGELTELLDQTGIQLFVFPVTENLLRSENNAITVLLPFALERRIPVLPILMESGLEKLYGQIFGNLQYLDPVTVDLTAIPYEEKLKQYLRETLVSRETAEKIRAAFDAYIFLSYRKKDRALASRLMKLIHEIPQMRDVAIWYDEFLVPGEDFNSNILEALAKSDLFTMAVTPNLVNEDNYVRKTEYPEALKAEKPILAAQVAATDADAFAGCFRELSGTVDVYNPEALRQALLEAFGRLRHIALAKNQDPMHNYLIGLAYLNGIDVEVDHEKAVELITGAAEQECVPAMEQLQQMYVQGIGVKRDVETGIRWVERQISFHSRSITTEEEAVHVLKLHEKRAKLWELLERFQTGKEAYLQTLELAQSLEDRVNRDTLLNWQVVLYLGLCRVSSRLGESPREYAEQGLRISERFDQESGKVSYGHMFCLQLAHWMYQQGDYEGARKTLLAVDEAPLAAMEDFAGKAISSRWREQILISRRMLLGRILEKLSGEGNSEEAIAHLTAAIEQAQALAVKMDKQTVWIQLAEGWKGLGRVLQKRDLQGAEAAYRSSIGCLERAYQDAGVIGNRRMLLQNYLGLGTVTRKQARYADAEGWLRKAAELARLQEAGEASFYVLDQSMAVYRELAMVCIHQRKWGRIKSWVEQGMQTVERYPQVFETRGGALMQVNFLFDVAHQCITWYRTEFLPQLRMVKSFQRNAAQSEGRRALEIARGYLETGLALVQKYEPVLGHEPCLIAMHNFYLELGTLHYWRGDQEKTRIFDGRAKQIAKELSKKT